MVARVEDAPPINLATPEWTGEMICGFRIHPLASLFPLIEDELFEELLESVAERGLAVPVEVHEGLIVDGRNRLRAIEVLRQRGLDVEVRTTDWQPTRGETLEEHLFEINVLRRHLTVDQRVVLGLRFLPAIREARVARQAASRFGTGERTPAAAHSSPPETDCGDGDRSSRAKDGRSTAGALSKLTKSTVHKARQGIKLFDDIEADIVPSEEMEAVLRGEKPLCRAGRNQKRPKPKKKVQPASRVTAADIFDDPDTDGEAPPLTPEEFAHQWERLKEVWPVTEHRDLRALALAHIAEEQRRFDR